MSMTKGTPASSQIISLEQQVAELQAEVEQWTAREIEWRALLRDLHIEMAAAKSERDQLKSCERSMAQMLRVAICPNAHCDNNGVIATLDICGTAGQEPCQWCHERAALTQGQPLPLAGCMHGFTEWPKSCPQCDADSAVKL